MNQDDNISICSATTTNTRTQTVEMQYEPSLIEVLKKANENQEVLNLIASKLSNLLNQTPSKSLDNDQKL